MGVRVLDRDRNGARLNEYGKALAFYAQSIESMLDRAKEETRLRSLGMEGALSIGISPVTSVGLVPQALEALLRDSPNVSVSITEDLDDRLLAMLRSGDLDLVVSRLGSDADYPDVASEPLFFADWTLIMRGQHPLSSLSSLSLKDLSEVIWVLPADGSSFRRQMETVFMTAGVDWPTRAITTNSILAIKSIVMSTNCVTIMSPRLVDVERELGRIHSVELTDLAPLLPVGLKWRGNDTLPPIASRFAELLRRLAHRATAV